MADRVDENAAMDPDNLSGFDVRGGIRIASVGEDMDDTLLMGHHDPDVAWAAFAEWQVYMGNWATVTDEPREHYQVREAFAAFSRHSWTCDDQAQEVCASCQAMNHDSCSDPCLCEDEYDHDDEGASATPVPCTCEDEYAWWITETKAGEPVTRVSYDWRAARERRLLPDERGGGAPT